MISRKFSHIYVEDNAHEYPHCRSILSRFPNSTVVPIKTYKEIINRPQQAWRRQKQSTQLVLAVREHEFIYRGSEVVSQHGGDRFFYNTLALNCLYDCSYCYLQGMFPSAHLVLFVNTDDYFTHTLHELQNGPLYLCISYETDLLALENIYPYCREWIAFAANQPNLLIELRTKSAAFGNIRDISPPPRVILAWTVSPQEVIYTSEFLTPRLTARLRAIQEALEHGWRVRLCLDPLLYFTGWQNAYGNLIKILKENIPLNQLEDISLGVFRMNTDYLKKARQRNPAASVLFGDFHSYETFSSYSQDEKEALIDFVKDGLSEVTERPIIIT